MNEHDATETAFNNGYKKGVEDAVRKYNEKVDRLIEQADDINPVSYWQNDLIAKEILCGNEITIEAECDHCACKLLDERDEARQEVAKIKADTVRKMQSEIEARCIEKGIYPVIVKRVVDEVAKEMVEGENENLF